MSESQGSGAVSPPTARVLDVVEALAQQPDRTWSLAELVRATGMTRATAHAVLSTLTARGWVHRSTLDKTYAIGPQLAVLGRELAEGRPLERLAHDAISKLAAELDLSVLTVHLVNDLLVVTDVASPPGGRTADAVVGNRIPYLPPFGPGFAAWAPADEQAGWRAHAARINPALDARLDQVLPEIRSRGYSLERLDATSASAFAVLARLQDDVVGDAVRDVIGRVLADLTLVDFLPGELSRGFHAVASIAAPVFDADGRVALNLAVQPRAKVSAAELRVIGDALADAAGRISASAASR